MSAPTIPFVVVEIPVKCFILQQQYCLYENGFQNDNVDRCLNITTVVTKMNKHYINREGNACFLLMTSDSRFVTFRTFDFVLLDKLYKLSLRSTNNNTIKQ